MAGKDKHPPQNPNRFSTNKRVKVGEKNAGLGAKVVKAPRKVVPKAVSVTASPAAKRNDKFLGAVATELAKQKKTGVIRDPNLLYNMNEARKRKVLRTMT